MYIQFQYMRMDLYGVIPLLQCGAISSHTVNGLLYGDVAIAEPWHRVVVKLIRPSRSCGGL